jgi:hypothetical protein
MVTKSAFVSTGSRVIAVGKIEESVAHDLLQSVVGASGHEFRPTLILPKGKSSAASTNMVRLLLACWPP